MHPQEQPAPAPDAIRAQVRRIVASGAFSGSERMCTFLEFAVERAIGGRAAELKEYVLGVEVFARAASFDPRVDPIVRVEARRLRSKLKAYYEGEGREDELLIEFPTGGYVPRIRYRRAQPAPPGAIAVLPFANLGAAGENDYFSDGLTEELIHALTTVPGLRVVAWHSAEKLRGQEADIYAVGRRLNVATVLTGSVRRQGGRLRVMARLVDTSSGVYLWSETYDRQVEDVIAIQEEISRAIAATLRVRLAPAALVRRSANIEAYNLYLQGRFHWTKRTPESLERAIRLFSEAVGLDPGFAAAHSGLADSYTLQVDFGFCGPEAASKGKASALRALELDPNLADAWASLALIEALSEWRWAEAGEHFRTAIRLNPGYVTARHWYGADWLAAQGRFDECLAEMHVALELDPLSYAVAESTAYVLLLARRYEESLEMCRKVAELEPFFYKAYTVRGRVLLHSGKYAEAVAMFEKGRSLGGDVPTLLGALGQAHGFAGNASEARRLLGMLRDMASTRHVPATARAMIHIGLGEKDQGIEELAGAVERREPSITAIKVHPGYDLLRGDERFEALVRKVFGG